MAVRSFEDDRLHPNLPYPGSTPGNVPLRLDERARVIPEWNEGRIPCGSHPTLGGARPGVAGHCERSSPSCAVVGHSHHGPLQTLMGSHFPIP